MSHKLETPFDSIEGSQHYVSLLAEAIAVTLADVETDIEAARAAGAARRVEALQLVHFKLTRLSMNMTSSSRILNDLRSLRRLLLDERTLPKALGKAAGRP